MSETWSTLGLDLLLELEPGAGRRTGLERALREAIRSGRLARREQLPSSRALAGELGLARGTVSAAYDQLVAEGHLVARRGSGTRVADTVAPPSDRPAGAAGPPVPRLDVRPGSPDVSTFPAAAWLRAARRALAAAPFSAYGYGDPRGRPELRTALSAYLARTRGVVAPPDRIVITSGYQQALSLLAAVAKASGTKAFAMEDPGLDFHRDIVARSGLRVLPLPVDRLGACTDLLAGRAYAEAAGVVVTPAHQYPTGVTLHPARRHALAAWARATGGLVVEDDYDGEFRYDRQPVGALQGMAPEHVVYVGSASKTLAPGVRLGWMVLPAPLVDPVVEAKHYADFQAETVGQLVLADLITSHAYDRHVRSCRLRYRRRRDVLVERLQGSGASARGITLRGIAAGLQTLLDLPLGGPTEGDVVAQAADRGLALTGLGVHWHTETDRHPDGLVVGFAAPPAHLFGTAVQVLVDVLRDAYGG